MLHSLRIPTIPSQSLHVSQHPPHLLRFRTSHRENIRYLKSLGVIDSGIKPHRAPSSDVIDRILSTVNFLKSKGFSQSDFPRLSFLCPTIFSPDSDPSDIEPVFSFLTLELAASDRESCGLILRCPQILLSDVEHCLRPTLDYLRELGVEKLNVPSSLNAHLLNTRVDRLAAKMRFIRSMGLSYEESARVCGRFPAVFGYSIENNLKPKLEYLVREMKRSVEELVEFPQYFAFSLENRIMPRHLHLQRRNIRIPLKRMLIWGDHKFYAKWN